MSVERMPDHEGKVIWKQALKYCVQSFAAKESMPDTILNVFRQMKDIHDQKENATGEVKTDYSSLTWDDLPKLGIAPGMVGAFMMFGMLTFRLFVENDFTTIVRETKGEVKTLESKVRQRMETAAQLMGLNPGSTETPETVTTSSTVDEQSPKNPLWTAFK